MAKKENAKLVKSDVEAEAPAAEGHNVNKGQYNEELVAIFEEHEDLEENKKQLGKAQKDLRNRAKSEFGVPIKTFNYLIAMRKLDKEVAAQFEESVKDVKVMIGYQLALELADNPEEK